MTPGFNLNHPRCHQPLHRDQLRRQRGVLSCSLVTGGRCFLPVHSRLISSYIFSGRRGCAITNMSTTATPSSNRRFDATACISRDVEEDPLGILRKVQSSGHDRNSSHRFVRPEEVLMDCENGNPCEVIDAILRNSQAIRDRVSSRQVSQTTGEDTNVQRIAVHCTDNASL